MSASKTSVASIAALFQQVKTKRDPNFISKSSCRSGKTILLSKAGEMPNHDWMYILFLQISVALGPSPRERLD